MAKRLNEQYNDIFKYVGEKFGLSKLTYETYKGLHETDVRKKRFDEFIENNFPIEKATDSEFINKIKELNENPLLKKEDRIENNKSFYGLGDILYPAEKKEETQKTTTVSSLTEEKKSKKRKKNIIDKNSNNKVSKWQKVKNFFGDIPEGLIKASAWSSGAFLFTRILGWNAGWPFATMALTANITLAIPAVFAGYCGYKLIKNGIKNGTFKKWGQKIKSLFATKTDTKENSKEETKGYEPIPTNFEDLDRELFGMEEPFETVSENTEIEPFPKEFETEPSVPVFEKPKMEKNTYLLPSGDEIDYSKYNHSNDEKTSDKRVEKKNPIPVDNMLVKESPVINTETELKKEIETTTPTVAETRIPKHAKKIVDNEKTQQELEERISQLEWRLEMLSANSKLPETEEQIKYVEDMKNKIKEELKRVKQEHKKYEPINLSTLLRARKATLVQKLNKLEKTEENKELISNIEIAIDQINSYINLERKAKEGLISEEQLNQKGNSTYSVVEYVLDESKKNK